MARLFSGDFNGDFKSDLIVQTSLGTSEYVGTTGGKFKPDIWTRSDLNFNNSTFIGAQQDSGTP
jgi:hypothetical protein